MKRTAILILGLAIALMAGNVVDAKVKRSKRKATSTQLPANLNELMRAPSINTNADGVYFINRDAPRSLPHLKVVNKEIDSQDYRATIYVDGKLLQTVKFGATQNEIKFFDANFDGYVDILFGAAFAREYSAIFLWNPSQKKFVEALNNGSFNGLMVVGPGNKELYSYLSGGATTSGYSISKWQGNTLVETERLEDIDPSDIQSYAEYGYRMQYSIINGNHKEGSIRPYLILETDELSVVPSKWRTIMNNVNACFKDY